MQVGLPIRPVQLAAKYVLLRPHRTSLSLQGVQGIVFMFCGSALLLIKCCCLLLQVVPGRLPQLAATGALRSVDPDRLIIKKIVLSGYPVRVHKTRAVVRLMFFNPDDIRWASCLAAVAWWLRCCYMLS